MRRTIGSAAFAAVLGCSMASFSFAAALPGETGASGQTNQQNVEQERVQQGIGRSGDLPMDDRGMRQPRNKQQPQIKDDQVTLGGSNPLIKGEVLKVEGENYTVRDSSGKEVRMMINQNTRMDCGPGTGSLGNLMPESSASDKPNQAQSGTQSSQGQSQDLARTNEQKGSEVGSAPGLKSDNKEGKTAKAECGFKQGDKIEAEVSDMGAATFIKRVAATGSGAESSTK